MGIVLRWDDGGANVCAAVVQPLGDVNPIGSHLPVTANHKEPAMPFIPAPEGTLRCVHNFTVQGQECLCVVYVEISDTPASSDLVEFANEMFQAWQTHLLPNQAAEITFNQVQVTDVHVAAGLQATSTEAPAAGGSANPSISNALAGVISLRTAFSGRSNRGRFYIPGLRGDQVDTDSNYFTTSFVTELQADASAWRTAVESIVVNALTTELVVTSYYTLQANPSPPPDFTTQPRLEAVNTGVNAVIARRRIGTQRRRRPRS